MRKLTPWFPWKIHPIHIGWYDYSGYLIEPGTRLYWNGTQFGFFQQYGPDRGWVHVAEYFSDKWRGLARKPK